MYMQALIIIIVINQIFGHAVLRFDEFDNFTSELTITETQIIKLVQNCFLLNDRTIAFVGDVPGNLMKKLHLMEIAAAANVADNRSRSDKLYEQVLYSKSLYRESFWIRLQRVVHTFIIAAQSQPLLNSALNTAKSSVWWNSASFFIVTSTFAADNDDCKNAFNYLWTLWQMGILYSIFLCKNNDGSLATYGYSPYYDGHGESWLKVAVHAGRDGHPWTLLKLKQVHDDINMCEAITFDKVKRLNDYPIRIGVLNIPPTLIINKSGETWLSKHIGEDAVITYIIWEALNGSMQTKYYNGVDPIGFGLPNESYTGFMADVSLGKVDHGINGLYANIHWRIKSTYPHAVTGIHFSTSSRGNMPTWLKFVTIYDSSVTIGILATLFVGTIFLRYVDNRPWSLAFLDIIRITLSLTMSRWPRRSPTRIFWSLGFFTILVTTSCFQGLLISLLTKPLPYQNIDGIDDLLKSGYKIYGYPTLKELFDGSKLSSKFNIDSRLKSCFDKVKKDQPLACVGDYMYLRSVTISSEKIHMSKESVSSFYTSYITKTDWPIFDRFDTIVRRLFNSGITGYWREFYLNAMAREKWLKMRNNSPPTRKVLSMTDLAFVFHVLIAGLLISSVAFVIEQILGRIRHTLR